MAKPPIRKPKKKVCLFCQEKIPAWTTRTPGCCGSSSPTAARSGPGGFPVTARSTSATSPRRSRTRVRWRCCPTRARRAEAEGGTHHERYAMKLILTQEVTGLGAPGDVVEVKAGYGRNYLVPRGLAMQLDPWRREADRADPARPVGPRDPRPRRRQGRPRAKLASYRCRLRTRAGGGGRLFGSVSTGRHRRRRQGRGRPELDKRRIEIGTRSRPSARTRCRSGCTPRSARRWTSRSRAPDAPPPPARPQPVGSVSCPVANPAATAGFATGSGLIRPEVAR